MCRIRAILSRYRDVRCRYNGRGCLEDTTGVLAVLHRSMQFEQFIRKHMFACLKKGKKWPIQMRQNNSAGASLLQIPGWEREVTVALGFASSNSDVTVVEHSDTVA